MTTSQQQITAAEQFPGAASILAIAGGCLMIVAGLLILGVGVFVIPHLNPSVFANATGRVQIQNMPGFVGGILTGVGAVGLVSGFIVFASGFMLRLRPDQSAVWGLLVLIFSVLSFFGSGGFVIGAILGIVGGVMTLRWKRPAVATMAQAPTTVVPVA
ncbi:MAG: DUF6114 domain-containing protein [Nitrososphaerales archaeon]|jgi:hypothetical protein